MGFQRWECYWNGKTKANDCTAIKAHVQMMSTGTFNHILYAIRDVGFNINATGDPMPNGQHPQLTCFHLCGWMTPAVCSTGYGQNAANQGLSWDKLAQHRLILVKSVSNFG
jgi:hypothetical protein